MRMGNSCGLLSSFPACRDLIVWGSHKKRLLKEKLGIVILISAYKCFMPLQKKVQIDSTNAERRCGKSLPFSSQQPVVTTYSMLLQWSQEKMEGNATQLSADSNQYVTEHKWVCCQKCVIWGLKPSFVWKYRLASFMLSSHQTFR